MIFRFEWFCVCFRSEQVWFVCFDLSCCEDGACSIPALVLKKVSANAPVADVAMAGVMVHR